MKPKHAQQRTRRTARGRYYSELPPEQLDRMADQFEQEFMPTKPLTKSMRVQERRAKRGRPVVGEGATKVLVSLERGLLRAADSYAMESGKNRSQVIADGLRAILPVRALRSAG